MLKLISLIGLLATVIIVEAYLLKPKPPIVTDADVQAYLRVHEMADQVRHFHEWEWVHPDTPRTISFPEIITDPVMWDFTLNSVLMGKKKIWVWNSPSVGGFKTGLLITGTSVGTAATTYLGAGTSYTCNLLSGGDHP